MLVLTSKERRALLIISGVLLAGVIVQWLRPHQTNPKVYDYTLQDSLFKALSDDTLQPAPLQDSLPVVPPTKPKRVKRVKPRKAERKVPLQLHSININSASSKELQLLPRIGTATAQRIVDYRQLHGPFKSIDELIKIKRIGPKTLQKIRPYVTINNEK